MKTLIIGKGEVGEALNSVLNKAHDVYIRDIEDFIVNGIEVLHVCYPYHEGFDATTKKYIAQYKPKVTVINSSVPVGTSIKCGDHVVYSPIRGRHPKLSKDLELYSKFVCGGNNVDRAYAAMHFEQAGLNVECYEKHEDGELVKLLTNVHLGIEIAWRQEVERILGSFGVNPQVYEDWENSYRHGYLQSQDYHLTRPSMKPDPIGGHCILPCIEIIKDQYHSKIMDFVLESNEKRKGEVCSTKTLSLVS